MLFAIILRVSSISTCSFDVFMAIEGSMSSLLALLASSLLGIPVSLLMVSSVL